MAQRTFLGEVKNHLRHLHIEWETFSRQIFHFLKSLQLQKSSVGGSITNYQTVDQIRKYRDCYLAKDSSERVIVDDWFRLWDEVVKCVVGVTSQLTSDEKVTYCESLKKMEDFINEKSSLSHLARLDNLPLNEIEKRASGGIVNLIPEVLDNLTELIYELELNRTTQLEVHTMDSLKPISDRNQHSREFAPDYSWHSNDNIHSNEHVTQSEYLDRLGVYAQNQKLQRGEPFKQWKLNYLRL